MNDTNFLGLVMRKEIFEEAEIGSPAPLWTLPFEICKSGLGRNLKGGVEE